MSSNQGPVGTRRKSPGRIAVPVGATLLVLSIVIGVVGSAITVPKIENIVDRDVVISGSANPQIPGRLAFRVASSVSGDPDAPLMVGIALDSKQLPQPTCELETSDGDQIHLSLPSADAMLLRSDYESHHVVGVARLKPGSYEATCTREETAGAEDARFTVGHVFDSSDLSEFTPLFWLIGAVVISGILFLVGAIMLTVGLIRRSRARKETPWTPGPGPYGGPSAGGPYPGGPVPPGGYAGGGPGAPGAGGYPGQGTPSGYPAPPAPTPGHPGPPVGYPPTPPSGPGQAPGSAPQPGSPGEGAGEPDYPWRTPAPEAQSDQPTMPRSAPSGWTVPPSKK